jgi:hypothetical protein
MPMTVLQRGHHRRQFLEGLASEILILLLRDQFHNSSLLGAAVGHGDFRGVLGLTDLNVNAPNYPRCLSLTGGYGSSTRLLLRC